MRLEEEARMKQAEATRKEEESARRKAAAAVRRQEEDAIIEQPIPQVPHPPPARDPQELDRPVVARREPVEMIDAPPWG